MVETQLDRGWRGSSTVFWTAPVASKSWTLSVEASPRASLILLRYASYRGQGAGRESALPDNVPAHAESCGPSTPRVHLSGVIVV